MTTTDAHTPPTAPHAGPGSLARHAPAGVALAVAGALALGWQGGWLGAMATAAMLAVGLGLPWLRREAGHSEFASDAADLPPTPRAGLARFGAEVMVGQVVPVWVQQLDASRAAAADGLGKVLQGFEAVAGALGQLSAKVDQLGAVAPTAAAGGTAGPLQPALSTLLAPSQRALAERDAAMAELKRCAQALDPLQQAGRAAREIGRHTRLVAFNASIEAQRKPQAGANGAVAVALETRDMAERMAEVGDRIGKTVATLSQTLAPLQRRAALGDSSGDELRLELDLCARQALQSLLGPTGDLQQGSADVRQTSQVLRQQVNELLVHFQFIDQLAQTLGIVGADMHNFSRWVATHPQATQSDAADWLCKLEASYTSEAQRSRHHGNVAIDRGREVQVF